MTYFYYKTNTWNSQPQISEETINLWKHLADKSNWRITQLPNGYYQTEYQDIEKDNWYDVTRRETIKGAEQAGMVGINVPIPVPVGHHSFGGWDDSLFGDTAIYGPEGMRFYTKQKVITSRWPDPTSSQVDLGFPQNS